jgi:ketosteroid isomerase-like protein
MTKGDGQGASLAQAFIDATESRDLAAMRELFHPEAKFWTNITLQDSDLESRFLRIAREFEIFATFGFTKPRIDDYGSGFVIRAGVKGSLQNGVSFEFPVCIVGDSRGGKIERLEEYLDMAPVAPILTAMA